MKEEEEGNHRVVAEDRTPAPTAPPRDRSLGGQADFLCLPWQHSHKKDDDGKRKNETFMPGHQKDTRKMLLERKEWDRGRQESRMDSGERTGLELGFKYGCFSLWKDSSVIFHQYD